MRTQHPTLLHKVLMLLVVFGFLLGGVSMAAEEKTPSLELKLGGAKLIKKTDAPVSRVAIANPDIADIVVLSPSEIYIYGKKPGFTSAILWSQGHENSVLNVTVSLDVTPLKEQLYKLFPNENIEVYPSETGVVLSGTVSGPEVVEQALRLTRTFLPKTAESTQDMGTSGKSGSGITNLLKVGNLQQVMLEVTIAEVSRNSGRDLQAGIGLKDSGLGNDFHKGGVGTGPLGLDSLGNGPSATDAQGNLIAQAAQTLLFNFAGNTASAVGDNAANIFVDIGHFTAALQFLESEGLARTLAEPRLVTMTGQEASFLAGGQFPIPVQNGGITNAVTIEYKDFGVGLSFTPVIMSDGKISLRVAPSVSSITDTVAATSNGGVVPILSTRQLETTVQLYDGQTLALAGLLQDNMREVVRKIPYLADIPVLGPLFRSTNYTQDKTDLLIAVTPHLVKPGKEGDLKFPGADIRVPNRYEFYMEGLLEGRRYGSGKSAGMGHDSTDKKAASGQTGGLEGNFGYQPVKKD